MVRIKPFCARRPQPGWEREIAALPYDVLTREQAARMASGHPDSMLHVTRPEIAFPEAVPLADGVVQAAARKHYRALISRGRLVADAEPCYYLYEQQLGAHRQRGIVALFHVDDYRRGIVRRHESTRRDKELERTRLLRAVGAQPGLVFLACRDTGPLTAMLEALPDCPWLYDFEAPDGAYHRIMPLTDTATVATALASVPVAYIADGHHRAAAAASVAGMEADRNDVSPALWFPAALFPADSLKVFAYHRCVRTLGNLDATAFLRAVRERFNLSVADPLSPVTTGVIRLLMTDGCWDMRPAEPVTGGGSVADGLDVAVLQNHLLQPLLGIDDPRENPNIEFVGGSHAHEEIMQSLQTGRCVAAFMMAPVPVGQMMRVADDGGSMPPKSTWFEPKLLEGLLVHDREAQP